MVILKSSGFSGSRPTNRNTMVSLSKTAQYPSFTLRTLKRLHPDPKRTRTNGASLSAVGAVRAVTSANEFIKCTRQGLTRRSFCPSPRRSNTRRRFLAGHPFSIGDGEDGIVCIRYKRVVIIRILSRIFRYIKVMWTFKSILATD
jgi:hypothetical protein